MRRNLTRFRIGMSSLNCNFLQFSSCKIAKDSSCPFCTHVPETEVHFLLQCPKYDDLRKELIPPKYHKHPSLFKFTLLMASENKPIVINVAYFIHKALDIRKHNLSA
eukprot:TRINITY_DN39019_c0_g1_i2.p1 TRINITY_DN39019_c0_g1~~TRINITY_DN39019_c0_g1_i2.p1  ORF type:complete len:107 (-),score=0.38 TRINITY_DN39019_c0_g1_i2:22-342(-)